MPKPLEDKTTTRSKRSVKKIYRKMQEDIAKSMCLDEMDYPFLKREWIDNEIGIFVVY